MAKFNLGTLTISARVATLVQQAATRQQKSDPTPLSARDWFVQVKVKELAQQIAVNELTQQRYDAGQADLDAIAGEGSIA